MTHDPDRLAAAVHEAAHLTVAFALGDTLARAWVFPAPPGAAARWAGQCAHTGGPAESVAGGLAEIIALSTGRVGWTGLDAAAVAGVFVQHVRRHGLDRCGISHTDRARFPPPPEAFIRTDEFAAVVELAARALVAHGVFFEWAVNELVEGGEVLHQAARRQFFGRRVRRANHTL